MKPTYLVVPLLCTSPFLSSCTTLTTSLVGYGMESMLKVQHAGESPEAYYQLGRYYQAQNRFVDAAKAYERALALRSDYVEATNALATAYAMQGQYDVAIAKLEAAVEQSPAVGYLHNNLGYLYYLQGRYPKAIASLETATRLEPKSARAWLNLAAAYAKSGAAEKSREANARASRLTSRVVEAHTVSHTSPAKPRGNGVERQERAAHGRTALFALHPGPRGDIVLSEVEQPVLDIVPVAPNVYELRAHDRPAGREMVAQAAKNSPPSVKDGIPSPAARLSLRPFRLEVSNGNGKTGLARRTAARLKAAGMNTVRLTNQRPWQAGSEIQYREGYAWEAARLANLLAQEAMMIRNDRLRSDIQVRLVLGKDVGDEKLLVKSPGNSAPLTVANVK